jgi:hypothetical protein
MSWSNRCLVAVLVAGFLASTRCGLAATATPMDFTYPGSPARVNSPSGNLSVVVKKKEDKGAPGLRMLILEDGSGKALAAYEFDRRVEGQWSSSGTRLFFNDYEGSDTVDCFIPVLSAGRWSFRSLTEILNHSKSSGPVDVPGIKPPETPENSHYYLRCTRWVDADVIAVDLHGVTLAGGDFHYDFLFRVSTKHFELSEK